MTSDRLAAGALRGWTIAAASAAALAAGTWVFVNAAINAPAVRAMSGAITPPAVSSECSIAATFRCLFVKP